MNNFDFDALEYYVLQDRITDLNYNGKDLWVDDIDQGRYVVENFSTYEKMVQLMMRFSNYVNMLINDHEPVLETDYQNLRVSILHESVCGVYSMSIRKTSYEIRIQEESIEETEYMSKSCLKFLKYAVQSKCNIVVSGLPGSGKTEMIKFLTQFIPDADRVITIEDSSEIHYNTLHPHRDCVAVKVNAHLNYAQAIKASLRQRPNWIMLSEARGEEVIDLMASISTGTHIMSTIHARSAQEIPMRFLHMMPGADLESERLMERIHDMIDIGIHMEQRITSTGSHRYVHEIVVFQKKEAIPIYHVSQKKLSTKIPLEIKERAAKYGVRW